MRQIHRILGSLILVFTVLTNAGAQGIPPIGLGLRGTPDGGGIDGKFYFTDHVNIEAMFNRSNDNYYNFGPSNTVVGLLEYNFLFKDPHVRIYIGTGIHMAWAREFDESNYPAYYHNHTFMGLDMIGGVEYVFGFMPIGLSVDVKPGMNFYDQLSGYSANDFGFSLRYYFGNWDRRSNYRGPSATGR